MDSVEVKQIKLRTMEIFCYLIGDEESHTCALVDPAFETKKILSVVEKAGYRVTHIINTHNHADHTAGNAAIKAATGAEIVIHELDARALTAFTNSGLALALGGRGSPAADRLVKDGDVIEIGAVKLSVIHTPGHTAGGICLYTEGHLFTGDTLFVGAVGRTDLSGGSDRELLRAIRERIYTLPPDTIVWPGHDYGPLSSSTVAREKSTNPFTRA
jgi:hydroxyacylglutathione hydrolase